MNAPVHGHGFHPLRMTYTRLHYYSIITVLIVIDMNSLQTNNIFVGFLYCQRFKIRVIESVVKFQCRYSG